MRIVVVGVGQRTFRPQGVDEYTNPFDAMKSVVESAAIDAESPRLVQEADAIHVVNMLAWRSKDPPTALAERLGARPTLKEYTAIGGNTPQWLVNRVADNLALGRSRIAILAGCEVMHSLRLAGKSGKDIGAFSETVEVPVVGTQRPGTLEVEMDHGADLPVRIYPIFENALRAREGLAIAEQRRRLGLFGDRFSKVAASNPYAWHPAERTAEEIVTVTPKNRMLGFPYTRSLNSELYVDQAAAVIMTTPETAQSLGIPESKWVYIHGGQDAHDEWHVSHRPDLADLPAIRSCIDAALAQARRTLDDIRFFDLYSCFPCMPRMTQRVLGMAYDDPRPMTLTGGLPFFGGPGNNYVMHAIAEAVVRCRREPDALGMVTSNGYYATKHGVGIYGARAPSSEWRRVPPESFQSELTLPKPVEVDPEPRGALRVESYTVWHDRDGKPEYGIVVGRTSDDRRAWAKVPGEARELIDAMMRDEWIGKIGRISKREGRTNLIEFA